MYEKLADIFSAVAVKHLKAVDVPRSNSYSKGSNQHEIGGLVKAGFDDYIGRPAGNEKVYLKATMVYISRADEDPIISEDQVSWYDTRAGVSTRGPEYRLYYRPNEVTDLLHEGDFFLIALTKENNLLMVFTPEGSEAELQLRALFGALDTGQGTSLEKVDFSQKDFVLPIRTMLTQLGIELFASRRDDEEKLSLILETFGEVFPTTRDFSEFAREQTSDQVDAVDDPDNTLITWLDEEEHLFRLLERHIVAVRLREGFGQNYDDVDAFIKFSLSVQNRRKSRAGHSFENHIEQILISNEVRFERGARTEGKQTPDFLFPGRQQYLDSNYEASRLRMLGAKTSCKERWRQVLAEAKRIERKHLITLEPAISQDQTDQMQELKLQLVVPSIIQEAYSESQQDYLMNLGQFIAEVKGSTT